MNIKVLSNPNPLPGQRNRSSNNFNTTGFNCDILYWKVGEGVSFHVMKDVSGGKDKTIFKSLSNGSTTVIEKSDKLYIANPSGASEDFMITISDEPFK